MVSCGVSLASFLSPSRHSALELRTPRLHDHWDCGCRWMPRELTPPKHREKGLFSARMAVRSFLGGEHGFILKKKHTKSLSEPRIPRVQKASHAVSIHQHPGRGPWHLTPALIHPDHPDHAPTPEVAVVSFPSKPMRLPVPGA